MNRYERETTIVVNDGEAVAHITTYQRAFLRKLRAHPEAKLIAEGEFEGVAWGQFEVPAELVTIRRRRSLTDQQKANARTRLSHARQTRVSR
jgi:hypothetical protein